ncbi:hypothetical protein JB92DRAFT_2827579 [Gautieria morchelliformis]|nr:hypothetical protein JB92DRAFT_2827579 [Gautieria morchelliformis]
MVSFTSTASLTIIKSSPISLPSTLRHPVSPPAISFTGVPPPGHPPYSPGSREDAKSHRVRISGRSTLSMKSIRPFKPSEYNPPFTGCLYGLLRTDMAVFPNLTHIVLGVATLPPEGHLYASLTPLLNIARLQVIGMQSFVAPNRQRALYSHGETLESTVQESPFHNNPKIIVIPGEDRFTPSYWGKWFQGGDDIWEAAEQLLSESRS